MEGWKKFYSTQSAVTDPGAYKALYDALPDDIPSLCTILQGLVVHLYWGPASGFTISDERKAEVTNRKVTRQVKRILELDSSPLEISRPVEKKMIGTCRDYATLLISILRSRGIPARLRVAFAAYLKPDRCEEHYLCQYWNKAEERWITVDAQLDPEHCSSLNIRFDPYDVPEDRFYLAGKAWQICRREKVKPELFGILELRGTWFIGGALIHDMLALNKIESHPWDVWPLMPGYQQKDYSADYLDTLDRIAALSAALSPDFSELRSFYQSESRLQPPPDWEPWEPFS